METGKRGYRLNLCSAREFYAANGNQQAKGAGQQQGDGGRLRRGLYDKGVAGSGQKASLIDDGGSHRRIAGVVSGVSKFLRRSIHAGVSETERTAGGQCVY